MLILDKVARCHGCHPFCRDIGNTFQPQMAVMAGNYVPAMNPADIVRKSSKILAAGDALIDRLLDDRQVVWRD